MAMVIRRSVSTASSVLAILVLQLSLGVFIAVSSPTVGAVSVVAIGLLIVIVGRRTPLAVLAIPAVVASKRLAFGGADLSYADAALLVSALLGVRLVPLDSVPLRRMFAVAATFLSILAIPVMFHPTTRALIEAAHRVGMIVGGLVAGAAIARNGGAKLGLRLFVGAMTVIAIEAVRDTFARDLDPAYPFGINKNFAGLLLVYAVVLVVAGQKVISLALPIRVVVQVAMLAGLLACQSRGAASALLLMMFFNLLRRGLRNSLVVVVGLIALVVMIWSTTSGIREDGDAATPGNSYAARVQVYDQAMSYWRSSPVTGIGIRYWVEMPETSAAHNVAIEALAETGVIGLAAVIVLTIGTILVMWRVPGPLAWCAVLLTLGHTADALVGIFWVAGTGTLPWLLVGLGCGMPEAMGEGEPVPKSLSSPVPV